MTTIAVAYNKAGVAVASDSAASITYPNGTTKIFNANKIFRISNNNDVGVAIYQNSEFCGLPRETIIKAYRKHNEEFFLSLEDSILDFQKFIISSDFIKNLDILSIVPYFINDLSKDWNSFKKTNNENYSYINHIVLNLKKRIDSHISNLQHAPVSIVSLHEGCLSTSYNTLTLNNAFIDNIRENIKKGCNEFIDINSEKINNEQKDFFIELFKDYFSIFPLISNNYTGLVFFGFGDNEYTPQVSSFVLHYKYENSLIIKDVQKMNPNKSVEIYGFADNNTIFSYLRGINPELEERLKNIKVDSFQDSSIRTKIMMEIERYKNEQISETISTTNFLSIDELGKEVETLVKMSSFKKRISSKPETIGGNIDVAVITKGDGFIWINRKHYFTKEQNDHYFNKNG